MEFTAHWTLYLLTLTLLTSISFRLTCSPSANLSLTPTTRRNLTAFHAFAVEGIQLALLVLFCLDGFAMALNTTWTNLTDLIWLVMRMGIRALLLVAGVIAVDVIEHPTVLGEWYWTMGGQGGKGRMFVLTRERMWPALKMWWKGLRVLGEGGLLVYAGKGKVGEVGEIVLRRVGGRRWSESNAEGIRQDASEERGTRISLTDSAIWSSTTKRARRHSFPDDQLNTRPLLIDSRITSSMKPPPSHHGVSTTTSSPTVSRGRSPTKVGKEKGKVRVSCDGSPERRSRVRSRVWEIEGGRSQYAREKEGSKAGERGEKGRWRYPGRAA